jgi:hypothetical protein
METRGRSIPCCASAALGVVETGWSDVGTLRDFLATTALADFFWRVRAFRNFLPACSGFREEASARSLGRNLPICARAAGLTDADFGRDDDVGFIGCVDAEEALLPLHESKNCAVKRCAMARAEPIRKRCAAEATRPEMRAAPQIIECNASKAHAKRARIGDRNCKYQLFRFGVSGRRTRKRQSSSVARMATRSAGED